MVKESFLCTVAVCGLLTVLVSGDAPKTVLCTAQKIELPSHFGTMARRRAKHSDEWGIC